MLFFEDLFGLSEKIKIQNYKKLTKKTIDTLLNELFTTNEKSNTTVNSKCIVIFIVKC